MRYSTALFYPLTRRHIQCSMVRVALNTIGCPVLKASVIRLSAAVFCTAALFCTTALISYSCFVLYSCFILSKHDSQSAAMFPYLGHTAVSHDAAAGSLICGNMLVDP